jgi:hypothetical protein
MKIKYPTHLKMAMQAETCSETMKTNTIKLHADGNITCNTNIRICIFKAASANQSLISILKYNVNSMHGFISCFLTRQFSVPTRVMLLLNNSTLSITIHSSFQPSTRQRTHPSICQFMHACIYFCNHPYINPSSENGRCSCLACSI